MVKNSFSLLETIIAFTIICILIGGFYNYSFQLNNPSIQKTLKNLDYENFEFIEKKRLNFYIDDINHSKDISVYRYKDSNFRLLKYE